MNTGWDRGVQNHPRAVFVFTIPNRIADGRSFRRRGLLIFTLEYDSSVNFCCPHRLDGVAHLWGRRPALLGSQVVQLRCW